MAETKCFFALTKITPIGYKQHVKAAEATLVIAGGKKISESAYSLVDYATKIKRPCIITQLGGVFKDHDPVGRISDWIKKNRFKTLNCAVNRDIWYRSRKQTSDLKDPWEPVTFLILNVIDALSSFCDLTQVSRIIRPTAPRKCNFTGRLYRHGDLLIRQIKRLPGGLKAVRSMILAAGEETGHCHELHPINGSMLQVYENRKGTKYFKAGYANLTHQEHNTINVEKGFYRVRHEQEFDYFLEEDRAVSD